MASQPIGPLARYSDDPHQALLSRHCCPDKVLRLAACAERNQEIIWLAQAHHLAREYFVIPIIVGNGGQDRCIGGESKHRVGRALALETANQFRREVLRLGGASPVARDEHFMPITQGLDEPRSRPRQRRRARHELSQRASQQVSTPAQGIHDTFFIFWSGYRLQRRRQGKTMLFYRIAHLSFSLIADAEKRVKMKGRRQHFSSF